MNYKLIIFDWDGTLMDSAQAIVTTLQKSIAAVGLPERSEDDLRYIIGLGMHEALDYLYPDFEVDWQALAQYYRKNMVEMNITKAPLYKGVVDMLETLKDKGYDLAVATGKSRSGLNHALAQTGVEQYFISTKTADETASKPNPLMLEELLLETALDVSQALMVGDTEFDIAMAQTIRMDCVAVEGGAHSRSHIEKFNPNAILNRARDLPQWLDTQ